MVSVLAPLPLLLLLPLFLLARPASSLPSDRPWMDPSLSVDDRVNLLLPRLSLAEKVAQTLHVWTTFTDDKVLATYNATGVGAMYTQHLSHNATCNLDLKCRVRARNALQAAIMKRCVPMVFGVCGDTAGGGRSTWAFQGCGCSGS